MTVSRKCGDLNKGYILQGTAVYLASDEDSSYVTGAIMNVTGQSLTHSRAPRLPALGTKLHLLAILGSHK